MLSSNRIYTAPRDAQDEYPAGYDADGNEIWHDDHTVHYEGKEVVWETFRDAIKSRLETKAGVLTLAGVMELEITRYE